MELKNITYRFKDINRNKFARAVNKTIRQKMAEIKLELYQTRAKIRVC